ncbi:unnamed protein product, partial [Prorocentrum cordatum]
EGLCEAQAARARGGPQGLRPRCCWGPRLAEGRGVRGAAAAGPGPARGVAVRGHAREGAPAARRAGEGAGARGGGGGPGRRARRPLRLRVAAPEGHRGRVVRARRGGRGARALVLRARGRARGGRAGGLWQLRHVAAGASMLQEDEAPRAGQRLGWPGLRSAWIEVMQRPVQARSGTFGRSRPRPRLEEDAARVADEARQAHVAATRRRLEARREATCARLLAKAEQALRAAQLLRRGRPLGTRGCAERGAAAVGCAGARRSAAPAK